MSLVDIYNGFHPKHGLEDVTSKQMAFIGFIFHIPSYHYGLDTFNHQSTVVDDVHHYWLQIW